MVSPFDPRINQLAVRPAGKEAEQVLGRPGRTLFVPERYLVSGQRYGGTRRLVNSLFNSGYVSSCLDFRRVVATGHRSVKVDHDL